MAKIHEWSTNCCLHQPYLLDLAPSDFHLFPKLKITLSGRRFSTTEELTGEAEGYFSGLEESRFREGIQGLEHHWTKCISLQGDYVEK